MFSKKLYTLLILTSCTFHSFAQNGVNSPYSRYGFGILSDRSMGFNKGMGGVAMGWRDGQIINVANPASYSAVDSTTALFDLGISLHNDNLKMGNLQQNAKNTSFDYFAFHFRASKNVGVALGILPFSNIKYSFASSAETINNNENVTANYNYSGDGGLRQAFLGAGWQPFKPISVGFNAGFLWGDYSHAISKSLSESTAYSITRSYTANITTFTLDFGAQYIQPLSKKNSIVIGASYSLGHNINSNAVRLTQTMSNTLVQKQTGDTIKNAFQLPQGFAAGVTFNHDNKLKIGADFELQKWGDVKFPNQDSDYNLSDNTTNATAFSSSKGALYDKMRIAAGAEWTPNKFSNSFADRITYKIGGYWSTSYADADLSHKVGEKPYEFGVSAGVSLPIFNRWIWHNSPKVNISAQWVHTNIPYLSASSLRKDYLKENYLKLCIGITFSEYWFFKYKVQ